MMFSHGALKEALEAWAAPTGPHSGAGFQPEWTYVVLSHYLIGFRLYVRVLTDF